MNFYKNYSEWIWMSVIIGTFSIITLTFFGESPNNLPDTTVVPSIENKALVSVLEDRFISSADKNFIPDDTVEHRFVPVEDRDIVWTGKIISHMTYGRRVLKILEPDNNFQYFIAGDFEPDDLMKKFLKEDVLKVTGTIVMHSGASPSKMDDACYWYGIKNINYKGCVPWVYVRTIETINKDSLSSIKYKTCKTRSEKIVSSQYSQDGKFKAETIIENGEKKLVIKDVESGNIVKQLNEYITSDVKTNLSGFFNPRFSLDEKKVYFRSIAWTTSTAIQEWNIETGEVRFITDGNSLIVIPFGEYAGKLIASKHKYFIDSGTYDFDWLIDPETKEELGIVNSWGDFVDLYVC
jgi:hypothetical protein